MDKIIIYQLIPRLFSNLNTTCKTNGSIVENGCGKLNDINVNALASLNELGITHIWFTGVLEHATTSDYTAFGISTDPVHLVKGNAGSPYAIKDYYDICPDLAVDIPSRMKEFEQLIKRTHTAGLKVIIDFVPNHVARHYESDAKPNGCVDFGASDHPNDAFNPQNNYYYLPNQSFISPVNPNNEESKWVENPARVTGNDCISASPTINDWYETVKLNYGINIYDGTTHFDPVPNTWHKMVDILLFWASKGIDGFRCDMAEMVPVEFWNYAIAKVKTQYPDILFIAEVYNPQLYQTYISNGLFDLLYDKVGMYDVLRSVVQHHVSTKQISDKWHANEPLSNHLLIFTENHDEQRVASDFFAKNAVSGFPTTFVAATINARAIMIYFGQEFGEKGMDSEGFSGLDGRTTIFDYWGIQSFQNWVNQLKFDGTGLTDEQLNVYQLHKKIISLVKSTPALNKGSFYDLMWYNADNQLLNFTEIFMFFRFDVTSVFLVIANFNSTDAHARIRIPEDAFAKAGLKSKDYFRANDLMNPDISIQFPTHVAIVNGFGLNLKAYQCSVFQLK